MKIAINIKSIKQTIEQTIHKKKMQTKVNHAYSNAQAHTFYIILLLFLVYWRPPFLIHLDQFMCACYMKSTMRTKRQLLKSMRFTVKLEFNFFLSLYNIYMASCVLSAFYFERIIAIKISIFLNFYSFSPYATLNL